MNIFLKEEDVIKIDFMIAQNINGYDIFIGKNKDDILIASDGGKLVKGDYFEEHFMVFKYPAFGDKLEIIDGLVDETGLNVKIAKFRLNKFIKLLKDWSFKDASAGEGANDAKAKISEESILKLHPAIVSYVGDILDEIVDGPSGGEI